MAGPLSGHTALVTGAARGIGLAIATRLAEAGAHAIIHDRDVVAADAATTDLRAKGLAASTLIADLAEAAAPSAMAAELKANGNEPDILVLCASVETLETWDAVSEAAMAAQTEINLHATVRLLQAFLPGMLMRGFGRIIAIGSVQEARPNPTHFHYAATKAAQSNMILDLARTLRAPDVTCNIIRPGAILTDRNRAVLGQPGREEQVLARIPLGRLGRADDCAGVALLLCSREGSYINGAEIAVDGGMRL
ncbi:NAD(P)-dependent dehydrogenase, short-chain alcohol dehydrogenase family [Bosea lupini]|uniref:NAD(P)-dependent dehydrogenase, short-chain alcohol dehydrogenase family n=1 Tax=Bosea lupini TaxID=1036779 RepID=A0A1H7TED2_9HYPH|nr:SDR family oxidoreductase [Bosea lupini]SEL83242.1 NAD(P)-dependent dehydrogenase, short-chain alcohol dehydrogenase family [Bosea lupini]